MVSLRLMPRDVKFFDMFIADGDNMLAAAEELRELMQSNDKLDKRIARIQELEHSGDEIGQRLDEAFITPFDREDIHELARRMDDVGLRAFSAARKSSASIPVAGSMPPDSVDASPMNSISDRRRRLRKRSRA